MDDLKRIIDEEIRQTNEKLSGKDHPLIAIEKACLTFCHMKLKIKSIKEELGC